MKTKQKKNIELKKNTIECQIDIRSENLQLNPIRRRT